MSIMRTLRVCFLGLTALGGPAAAQQVSSERDSARAEIHTRLRGFYFNLAGGNWEALTADILAAKVVAHRSGPEAFVIAASSREAVPERRATGSGSGIDQRCSSSGAVLVDRATIVLDGDWAEVSVPHCAGSRAGADEFRLIHFQQRWRFVYIRLFQDPASVSGER